MKLEIINNSLQYIVLYLPNLKLDGRGNRARQKLLKKVAEKTEEFHSDLKGFNSDYEDEEKRKEAVMELIKETTVIDMTEYDRHMRLLLDLMIDYPHEIDTATSDVNGNFKLSDATVHDYIIDVLEDAVEKVDNEQPADVEVVE